MKNYKYKYIFGPVPSRRLGLSLGIDLLGEKICSMDCIYCEVGRTAKFTMDRAEYVPADEVLEEFRKYLKNYKSEKLNFITFSGMGEPTLNNKLGYLIDKIHEMTDIPVCVLTNSTTIIYEDVFNDLLKADVVIPSLDAVSEKIVSKLNKPKECINFDNIIQRLSEFKKIFKGKMFIEILFVKGENDKDEELALLNEAVKIINPDGLQIHTVERPSLSGKVEPVDDVFLNKARASFCINSSEIKVFSQINKSNSKTDDELIISLLKIRSCHFDEIVKSTGMSKEKLIKLLKNLDSSGRIIKFNFANETYYKIITKN
ncbi:MAG: radical SAM protein [Candidatus Delongbacteria bacterium]|nr:radical SAM protein [Candidatus Delongbacteria bacterium]MCG2760285.1 radical SAM protein [Candidatus Delongbacteria bacterium]